MCLPRYICTGTRQHSIQCFCPSVGCVVYWVLHCPTSHHNAWGGGEGGAGAAQHPCALPHRSNPDRTRPQQPCVTQAHPFWPLTCFPLAALPLYLTHAHLTRHLHHRFRQQEQAGQAGGRAEPHRGAAGGDGRAEGRTQRRRYVRVACLCDGLPVWGVSVLCIVLPCQEEANMSGG